jgi:ribosome-associated protein
MRIPSDGLTVAPGITIAPDELRFVFSRSGGPGGQHTNKVSTRVELLFDIAGSTSLTPDQKERVGAVLARRITRAGELRIVVDSERSQFKNRGIARDRLAALLRHALREETPRVPTRVTRSAKEKRRATKKKHGQKKILRRSPLHDAARE